MSKKTAITIKELKQIINRLGEDIQDYEIKLEPNVIFKLTLLSWQNIENWDEVKTI